MQLTIKGKNLDLNETARDYIDRKIGRLGRYLDSMIIDGTVELSVESTRNAGDSHVAQVTITTNNGAILRGETRAADLRTAVDAVADVMQRKVVRYKERVYRKGKAQAARSIVAEPLLPEAEALPEEETPHIVKTKHFAIKPMLPEEAAEQMELLGHDFFVFLNDRTKKVNVVYRRHDGHYGLIEPELS